MTKNILSFLLKIIFIVSLNFISILALPFYSMSYDSMSGWTFTNYAYLSDGIQYYFEKEAVLRIRKEAKGDPDTDWRCNLKVTGSYHHKYTEDKRFNEFIKIHCPGLGNFSITSRGNADKDPWLHHEGGYLNLTLNERLFEAEDGKIWLTIFQNVPYIDQFSSNPIHTIYAIPRKQRQAIKEEIYIAESFGCFGDPKPWIYSPAQNALFGQVSYPLDIDTDLRLNCRFINYTSSDPKFRIEVEANYDNGWGPIGQTAESSWTGDFDIQAFPMTKTTAKESYGIGKFQVYWDGQYRLRTIVKWNDDVSPDGKVSTPSDWLYFSTGSVIIDPSEIEKGKINFAQQLDPDKTRAHSQDAGAIPIDREKVIASTEDGGEVTIDPDKMRAHSQAVGTIPIDRDKVAASAGDDGAVTIDPDKAKAHSQAAGAIPLDPDKIEAATIQKGAVPSQRISSLFRIVSPAEGKTYRSAENQNNGGGGPIAQVQFKISSPLQTQFSYELMKRLDIDNDFHTVHTWFVDGMDEQPDGMYLFEETKLLASGDYLLKTNVISEAIINQANPPSVRFRVLGDKGKVVALGKEALQGVAKIIEPEEQRVYETTHQNKVAFSLWIELPETTDLEIRINGPESFTEVIDMTGTTYRATKLMPKGKYTVEARPTSPEEALWSGPVTFYLDVAPFEEDPAETTAMLAARSNTAPLETTTQTHELATPPLSNTLEVSDTSDRGADPLALKRLTPTHLMTISPVNERVYSSSMPLFIKTISPAQTEIEFRLVKLANLDGPQLGPDGEEIDTWYVHAMEQLGSGNFSYQTSRNLGPGHYLLQVGVQTSSLIDDNSPPFRRFTVMDKPVVIGKTAVKRSTQAQADATGAALPGDLQPAAQQGINKGSAGGTRRSVSPVIKMSRGTSFSTGNLTSLPVKHAADQKPVFEFERYDGRAWRKARSIRPVSLQPQSGGGAEIVTRASFRISEPGRYRFRVSTDSPDTAFSPYQEFVVVDPTTRSLTIARNKPEKIEAYRDKAAQQSTKDAIKDSTALDPANQMRTSDSARIPTEHQRQKITKSPPSAAKQASAQRQLMAPTAPPHITSPRPNQTYTAPAEVAIKTRHDSRFTVIYEVKRKGDPRYAAVPSDVLHSLPAGMYDLQVGYEGMPQRSQVSFTVKMPISKQAVQAQPKQQVQLQPQKSGKKIVIPK